MSLSKVSYVDGSTVITAANLNAIQDEIINQGEEINTNASSIDSLTVDYHTLYDKFKYGTWTPVIKGGTTTGSPTYAKQTGVYVKIDTLVYINCEIQLSAMGGMTGAITITGLPFKPSYRTPLTTIYDHASVLVLPALAETDNYIRLTCSNTTGNWNTLTASNITDTFHVNISGCYKYS